MGYELYSKGMFFFNISQIILIIISFAGNAIFARVISQDVLGIYALSYSIIYLFLLISSYGVVTGIQVYAVQYKKRGLFRNLLFIEIPITVFFIIFLFIFSGFLAYIYNSQLLGDLIKIGCIFFFGYRFFYFIGGIFFGNEKFNVVSYIILIGQVSGFILTIVFLIYNYSVIGIYLGLICAYFIQIMLSFIFGRELLFEKSDSNRVEDIKSVFKIALPAYSQDLFQYVFDALGILLIGLSFFKDDTALFFYAFNITNLILFFVNTMRAVGIPAFARITNEKRQFFIFKNSKFLSIGLIPVCFLMITYSNYITNILYGSSYFNAGYMLDFLIFFIIFRYYTSLFSIHYLNKKNRILVTIYRGISLAIFIILFYFLSNFNNYAFMVILSLVFGELCTFFLYSLTFLRETHNFKLIIKSKSFFSLIFLFFLYLGTIIISKYFFPLNLFETVIISTVLILIFPFLLSLFKILNKEEFELLEKITKPIKFFSRPMLFLINLIKKLSIKN